MREELAKLQAPTLDDGVKEEIGRLAQEERHDVESPACTATQAYETLDLPNRWRLYLETKSATKKPGINTKRDEIYSKVNESVNKVRVRRTIL